MGINIKMFSTKPQTFGRQMMLMQYQTRFFSVVPKLPRMELTVRTPYRTLFKDFSGFARLYVRTIKGQMAIGNKSMPRVYLLPPGEMKVHGQNPGEGNFARADSGSFMHTGGWLFVHDNNSIEVSLLECAEKELFNFDKLTPETSETESNAGKVATQLQEKTYKIFQKRR